VSSLPVKDHFTIFRMPKTTDTQMKPYIKYPTKKFICTLLFTAHVAYCPHCNKPLVAELNSYIICATVTDCCKCIYSNRLRNHRYDTDPAQIRVVSVDIMGEFGNRWNVGIVDCDSLKWCHVGGSFVIYVTWMLQG
jgi:hypothetical protein